MIFKYNKARVWRSCSHTPLYWRIYLKSLICYCTTTKACQWFTTATG